MAINEENTTAGATDTFSFYEPDTPAVSDENGVVTTPASPGKVTRLNETKGTESSPVKERDEVHIEEIHGPHYRYRHGFEYQETRGNKVDLRYKEATSALSNREESLEGKVDGAAHDEDQMVKILSHLESAITMLNEVYGTSYSLHKGDRQEVHIGDKFKFHKGDRFEYEEGTSDGDASIVSWGSTKEFNYGNSFAVNYVDKSPTDHKNSASGPLDGNGFDAATAESDVRPLLHSHWITEGEALVEVTVGDKYEKTTGVAVDVHHGAKHEYLLGWSDSMSFAGGAELHLAARSETHIGLKNENLIAGAIATVVGFRLDLEMGPHTTIGTESFNIKTLQSDISITDLDTKITMLEAKATNLSTGVSTLSSHVNSIKTTATKVENGGVNLSASGLDVNA